MKKLSQSKSLKIVAATSVALFSLVTVFSATFAWFSMNEQVGNNGQQVTVQPASGYFHKLSIHNVVEHDDDNYRFDINPWGTLTIENWNTREIITSFDEDADPCFMGSYDYLEKIHPVLFLFELGDDTVENYTATSQDPINLRASTATDYYLGDITTGKTLSATGNPLSSVVRFSSTVFASHGDLEDIITEGGVEKTDAETGVKTIYDTYDFSTDILANSGSFTQFNDSGSYDSFNQEPVIYSSTTATVKYIAVVFDYYELAMETIYGAFLGDEILEDTLGFVCDWTMVI